MSILACSCFESPACAARPLHDLSYWEAPSCSFGIIAIVLHKPEPLQHCHAGHLHVDWMLPYCHCRALKEVERKTPGFQRLRMAQYDDLRKKLISSHGTRALKGEVCMHADRRLVARSSCSSH